MGGGGNFWRNMRFDDPCHSSTGVQTLTGVVSSRFQAATPNLATVESIILARTKLPSMCPGTLNVVLDHEYIVRADTTVEPHEYFTGEQLKLQRCRVRGIRMWIMRPNTHEPGPTARTLELISHLKLRVAFGLVDGAFLDVEVEGS